MDKVSAMKIVAMLQTVGVPMLQLSCPLHYPKAAMGLNIPNDYVFEKFFPRMGGLVSGVDTRPEVA